VTFRRLHHALRFLQKRRERLLAEDMFARAGGGLHQRQMAVRPNHNIDAIDIRPAQHLLGIVIYRRYETPVDLLHALVRYKSTQALGGGMIDLFRDQGSLRADLLAVAGIYQRFFDAVGPKLLGAVLTEFSRNHERFRDWSGQARDNHLKVMKKVEENAKRRGEIAHDFTEMQMSLPFDLLRVENIIRHEKITQAYLTRLVDEVLLPVFAGKRWMTNRHSPKKVLNCSAIRSGACSSGALWTSPSNAIN